MIGGDVREADRAGCGGGCCRARGVSHLCGDDGAWSGRWRDDASGGARRCCGVGACGGGLRRGGSSAGCG
jgi:hypothetical protein